MSLQAEDGASAASHIQGVEDLNHGQGQERHGGSVVAVGKYPFAGFKGMAGDVGNHNQHGNNGALEKYVKSHAAGKDTFLRITGRTLHDIGFALLHTQSQGREAVGNQVDPQQMYRLQDGKSNKGGKEDSQNFRQVGGQEELNGLTDIGVNTAAFFYRGNNGCEVIICQNHVCHVLGYVRTGDTHSYADISALDGRSVVYAVSGHGGNHTLGFPGSYNADFVFRLYAGVHGIFLNILLELLVADFI